MITAVIIDDEQKNVSMLTGLLQQYCRQVTLLGIANNSAAGKKLIEGLKPQLVFLDIEMPYGSGFDLLQSMPGTDVEIIFITAFSQYAINAFRYAALDYLLKPVNIQELEDAVERAKEKINGKNAIRNYELLLRNHDEKDASKQTISITDKGEQYLVQLADIMYIIADGSYTHIHTVNKVIVTTKNLKDFENMFPATIFCRIHHGHLLNKNHIAKVRKGRGGIVLMKDGRALEISIRRKEDFMKMIQK